MIDTFSEILISIQLFEQIKLSCFHTDVILSSHQVFVTLAGVKGDLRVSDAIHKAVISIDESGTEAAALTAMAMAPGCSRHKKWPLIFHVDQPFAFLIFCRNFPVFTGRIMFPGHS